MKALDQEKKALFNIIGYQTDIDKIHLYAKDPYDVNYQLLINKQEITELTNLNDSKAFIKYLNDMHNIYKNIKEYNLDSNGKVLIVFDDVTADMPSNKKLNLIVTGLLIRDRKLNISLGLLHNLILLHQKISD